MAEQPIEAEYRAGYLIPIEPIKGQFDAERDKALIAKGSHFFCLGHLSAVAIEEQSKNPDYCCSCYTAIQEDRH